MNCNSRNNVENVRYGQAGGVDMDSNNEEESLVQSLNPKPNQLI